jgi:hypothetical protein
MSADDDIPALEADPRLFDLTHFASVALPDGASNDKVRGKSRGRGGSTAAARGRGAKRQRTEQIEDDAEESDYSHDSDESDEDGNDGMDDAAMVPAASPTASLGANLASLGVDIPQRQKRTAKKEKNIDGVASPLFPIVQSVNSAWLRTQLYS